MCGIDSFHSTQSSKNYTRVQTFIKVSRVSSAYSRGEREDTGRIRFIKITSAAVREMGKKKINKSTSSAGEPNFSAYLFAYLLVNQGRTTSTIAIKLLRPFLRSLR